MHVSLKVPTCGAGTEVTQNHETENTYKYKYIQIQSTEENNVYTLILKTDKLCVEHQSEVTTISFFVSM